MTTIESLADSASVPATPEFGSLLDLVRLRITASSAEVCDACNTINIGSQRHCKSCSHKLPAYFAAKGLGAPASPQWRGLAMPQSAFIQDFAAFCIVINALVLVTSFMAAP